MGNFVFHTPDNGHYLIQRFCKFWWLVLPLKYSYSLQNNNRFVPSSFQRKFVNAASPFAPTVPVILFYFFNVLLTVHLSIFILVINQLDGQN